MVPPFNDIGTLPPGIHLATWQEIADRFGGTTRRRRLLDGLLLAVRSLHQAGCRRIYIDGSFVTSKAMPGDFDACWDIDGVEPTLLEPVLLTFDQGRKAQKAAYGGELFPAQVPADEAGTVFLDFFQIDKRTGRQKGIVLLELEEQP